MSIVILEFEYDYYLVECPVFVADHVKDYQLQFDTWMSDKSNDHGYWVAYPPKSWFVENKILDPYDMLRDPDGQDALSYSAGAFVDWLNRFVLQDNAKILDVYPITERNEKGHAEFPTEYRSYPHLFF